MTNRNLNTTKDGGWLIHAPVYVNSFALPVARRVPIRVTRELVGAVRIARKTVLESGRSPMHYLPPTHEQALANLGVNWWDEPFTRYGVVTSHFVAASANLFSVCASTADDSVYFATGWLSLEELGRGAFFSAEWEREMLLRSLQGERPEIYPRVEGMLGKPAVSAH